jgi:GNAT superfamily N-acetyltransferase
LLPEVNFELRADLPVIRLHRLIVKQFLEIIGGAAYSVSRMQLEYIEDRNVDAALDAELRGLLSTCFTGKTNEIFQHQRFFSVMPQHRWLARSSEGQLVAHLALHDKIIGTTVGDLRVGGIAEVCVTPSHRGQGLVRQLLALSDDWMTRQGVPFGILLGKQEVYGSSGYRQADNLVRYLVPSTGEWLEQSFSYFLIKPFGAIPWPTGLIDLRGPKF